MQEYEELSKHLDSTTGADCTCSTDVTVNMAVSGVASGDKISPNSAKQKPYKPREPLPKTEPHLLATASKEQLQELEYNQGLEVQIEQC